MANKLRKHSRVLRFSKSCRHERAARDTGLHIRKFAIDAVAISNSVFYITQTGAVESIQNDHISENCPTIRLLSFIILVAGGDMQKEFSIRTYAQVEFVKITGQIQKLVEDAGIREGLCHVFIPHTTAGVTINEGADPDVVRDMVMELNKIVPFEDSYLHREGNSAAHIKASIMGSSAAIFVHKGKLVLGTWQSLFFCEFDGPRTRRVLVHLG